MNYSTTTHPHQASRRDVLEARFGLRVAARLSEGSEHLPHDVTERLRVVRDMALAKARVKSVAAASQVTESAGTVLNADGTLSHSVFGGEPGRQSWWTRLTALMPLLLLVCGLLAIHNLARQEQISATADIDTALLGDALPPEAYTDPGFDEFLRSSPESATSP